MTDTGADVVVVGAGLAGSLLACCLGARGFSVEVFERRPDPRQSGFVGGRSINLALSCRGLTALKLIEMDERILEQAIPMRGRMMHDTRGELTFQAYSARDSEAIHSVSRAELNLLLLEKAASYQTVRLRFSHGCRGIDPETGLVDFLTADGETRRVKGRVVVGSDGAFSNVRGALESSGAVTTSIDQLEHGYKELTIPAAASFGEDRSGCDGFVMEPNALHIWPRGGGMMIALPNQDRTFTCTLFWPLEGDATLRGFEDVTAARREFLERFPDAIELMPDFDQEFQANPVGSLVTVRTRPWSVGCVGLIGDAAHAIVPFYGQGMNCAFEDCRILIELIDEAGAFEPVALERLAEVRRPDADAIANLALENFVEMRDRVADPAFLLRKQVEHALHRLEPDRYTPLYNLVSFSNMRYSEAERRGRSVIELATRLSTQIGIDKASRLGRDELEGALRRLLDSEGECDVD